MTYPAGAYSTVPALRNIHKIRGKRCILKVWNAEHYGTRTSRVYAKSFDGPPSASPFKLKSPALSFKLVRSAPDCLTVRQKEVRRCVQLQIETWQALKTPSVASGTLENGTLQYPSKLPDSSFGYRIIERDPVRHREYGHDRMVFGLVDLGAVMHQRLSGTDDERRFAVGDISTANGGPQTEPPPHQNHQMGLDVDLGLYMTNYLGRRFSYIRDINADGRSTDGDYTFDAAANRALVRAMLTSPYFGAFASLSSLNTLNHNAPTRTSRPQNHGRPNVYDERAKAYRAGRRLDEGHGRKQTQQSLSREPVPIG